MKFVEEKKQNKRSHDLLALAPVVGQLVFRPAVHFEMPRFRLLAPVQRRFRGLRHDDRIVRIVRVSVRPLLHRPQLTHQVDHAGPFSTRHVQLLGVFQLERAIS